MDEIIHLCDTCDDNFDECISNPTFGIDRDPSLRGRSADVVVECPEWKGNIPE